MVSASWFQIQSATATQSRCQSLQQGRILIQTSIASERQASVVAQLYLPCSRSYGWEQITTYNNWPTLLPNILHSSCQVTADPRVKLLHQAAGFNLMLFSPKVDICLKVHEYPCQQIQFELVQGSFDAFEATLDFSDYHQGTLLQYQVRACLSFPVPIPIIEHGIQIALPANLKSLRQGLMSH